MKQKLKVNLRQDWAIKPEAMQLQGKTFDFMRGWEITNSESSFYAGETAMVPVDGDYPIDAPTWIASGDLVEAQI